MQEFNLPPHTIKSQVVGTDIQGSVMDWIRFPKLDKQTD